MKNKLGLLLSPACERGRYYVLFKVRKFFAG